MVTGPIWFLWPTILSLSVSHDPIQKHVCNVESITQVFIITISPLTTTKETKWLSFLFPQNTLPSPRSNHRLCSLPDNHHRSYYGICLCVFLCGFYHLSTYRKHCLTFLKVTPVYIQNHRECFYLSGFLHRAQWLASFHWGEIHSFPFHLGCQLRFSLYSW